jgi:hypothetical protein
MVAGDDKDKPNILDKGSLSWNVFQNYTNNHFQPYEQCDCPKGHMWKSLLCRPVRDNVLYFFKSVLESFLLQVKVLLTHLSFISQRKDARVIGHISTFQTQYVRSLHSTRLVLWLGSLITEHISKLKPKPKYLVFNAGRWPWPWSCSPDSIVKALNATDKSEYINHNVSSQTRKETRFAHDAHVCKSMQNRCVDVSWTKNLSGPVHYWDGSHLSIACKHCNIQLLNLLDELQWHFLRWFYCMS